ncbi:MAG: DNA polymerase IV, partial [Candidatus Thiodiazotropha taylori]|nr:DNA polymerase IV [Candidatus Thiodiazotropha taylori]MCW4256484.1 DNA polymerase IV [Candidatus Thiodiazotropha taylori]
GEGCFQVQVTALDPKPTGYQRDLLKPAQQQRERLDQAMDEVNQRYGEFTLAPTRLLGRSKMPNVIAPAWKPFGHRETILMNHSES